MDAKEQILDLLEQLHSQTGIAFSIDENSKNDEDTIGILKKYVTRSTQWHFQGRFLA